MTHDGSARTLGFFLFCEKAAPGAAPSFRAFVSYLLPYFRPYWVRQGEVLIYMVIGALMSVLSLPVAMGAVVGALVPASPGGPAASGFLGGFIGDIQNWLRRGNTQNKLFTFVVILLLIYTFEAVVNMPIIKRELARPRRGRGRLRPTRTTVRA